MSQPVSSFLSGAHVVLRKRLPRQACRLAMLAAAGLLAACGGGGGASDTAAATPSAPTAPSTPLAIDTTVFASASADATQTMAIEATVDGPALVLAAAQSVQVCASGTWTQQLRGGGTVSLFTTSLAPAVLPMRAGPAFDAFGSDTLLPMSFTQCDTHALPAGTHALRYRFRVECPAACLAGYSLSLRWRAQPAG